MNKNTDPFEEFEFKPITEGLGFHRDPKKLISNMPKKRESSDIDTHKLFSTPLPKNNSPYLFEKDLIPSKNKTNDVVDEILRTIENTKKANREIKTSNQKSLKQTTVEYKKSNVILSAIFLDLMLVAASSLLCLVLLLSITKVDLFANLKNPDDQGLIYISTFCLFLSVGFIYYTCYRAFLGATPGEWAYDQKMAPTQENEIGWYTFKIVLRSILIIFSGIIFLPLLSWLLNKDLAGDLIGLHLVKKT